MTTSPLAGVEIVDVPASQRFEARVDGVVAGFAEYFDHGTVRTFPHTVVLDEFEGHGLAGLIAAHALDDARARGLTVIPRCPFFAGFIARHSEYADLVDPTA